MNALDNLPVHDLRPRLSVVPNPASLVKKGAISRRPRRGAVKGTVIHYNGPALPWVPNPYRELNFVVAVDVPNHQQRIGADSLMYHFVVLSDGAIWQTRDLNLIAWHAAHPEANEHYLGIHLPLGGRQQATWEQWRATARLHEALALDFGFPRERMTGHLEWSRTACPGEVMYHVREYRKAVQTAPVPVPPAITRWQAVWSTNVRQAPRVTFPNGHPVPIVRAVQAGEIISVDEIKASGDAQAIKGDNRWLHLSDHSGFAWLPSFKKL